MQAIILDRDGVINQDSDAYIKSADEWQALPGSVAAIARLQHAGHPVFVATNQSGLGRGLFDAQALQAMHNKLQLQLTQAGGQPVAIYFCPHTPADNCQCRKPSPGLYRQIAAEHHCSLENTIVIGDSLRDLQAAVTVGATPVLVRTGKGKSTEQQLAQTNGLAHIAVFDDLSQWVDNYLSNV